MCSNKTNSFALVLDKWGGGLAHVASISPLEEPLRRGLIPSGSEPDPEVSKGRGAGSPRRSHAWSLSV